MKLTFVISALAFATANANAEQPFKPQCHKKGREYTGIRLIPVPVTGAEPVATPVVNPGELAPVLPQPGATPVAADNGSDNTSNSSPEAYIINRPVTRHVGGREGETVTTYPYRNLKMIKRQKSLIAMVDGKRQLLKRQKDGQFCTSAKAGSKCFTVAGAEKKKSVAKANLVDSLIAKSSTEIAGNSAAVTQSAFADTARVPSSVSTSYETSSVQPASLAPATAGQ